MIDFRNRKVLAGIAAIVALAVFLGLVINNNYTQTSGPLKLSLTKYYGVPTTLGGRYTVLHAGGNYNEKIGLRFRATYTGLLYSLEDMRIDRGTNYWYIEPQPTCPAYSQPYGGGVPVAFNTDPAYWRCGASETLPKLGSGFARNGVPGNSQTYCAEDGGYTTDAAYDPTHKGGYNYACGDGGIQQVDVFNNDSANKPTGSTLGTAVWVPGLQGGCLNPNDQLTKSGCGYNDTRVSNLIGHKFIFNNPIPIVAGTLYHLVFTNTSPNYETNFIGQDSLGNRMASINANPSLIQYAQDPEALPFTDWMSEYNINAPGFCRNTGGQWVDNNPTSTSGPGTHTTACESVNEWAMPNIVLKMTDGRTQGNGYVQTLGNNNLRFRNPDPDPDPGFLATSGGYSFRQLIRPTVDITASDQLRLYAGVNASGTFRMTLRQCAATDCANTGAINPIYSTTVNASPLGGDTKGAGGTNYFQLKWPISPTITLSAGVQYALDISADSGTLDVSMVIDGVEDGYYEGGTFQEGYAQRCTSPTACINMNGYKDRDMQFLFRWTDSGGGTTTTTTTTTTTPSGGGDTSIPSGSETVYPTNPIPGSTIAIGSQYALENAHYINFICAGTMSGVWWYHTANDTGVNTVSAWKNGTLVGSGAGNMSAGDGWRYLAFSSPITVASGDSFLIGVHHPNGSYGYTTNGFTNRSLTSASGCMTAPASGATKNGMYDYSATPVLPTLSYADSEYFISPVFTQNTGTTTTTTTTIPGSAKKILAVGDSITEDNPANLPGANGGWRKKLYDMLVAQGRSVQFIGSHNVDNPVLTGLVGHEAFGGWATCDFFPDTGRTSVRTGLHSTTWDISQSVAQYNPDVVVIDIGTNNYIDDYFFAQGFSSTNDCPGTKANMERLFDSIVNAPSAPKVVITTIEDASIPNGTDYINTIITNYVTAAQAAGKRVCLATVPANSAGYTNTGDRYHLNDSGKLAWATAILPGVTSILDNTSCALTTSNLPPGAETAYPSNPTPGATIAIGSAWAVETAHRVNFTCTGRIYGVYWYRTAEDTGTITATAWRNGNPIASGNSDPTAGPGWRYLPFASSVSVSNTDSLIIGVYHPNGSYGYSLNGFTARSVSSPSGCFTMPASVSGATNGLYDYLTSSALPASTYQDSEYFLSPVFVDNNAITTTTTSITPVTTTTTTTTTPTTVTTTTVPGSTTTTIGSTSSTNAGTTTTIIRRTSTTKKIVVCRIRRTC